MVGEEDRVVVQAVTVAGPDRDPIRGIGFPIGAHPVQHVGQHAGQVPSAGLDQRLEKALRVGQPSPFQVATGQDPGRRRFSCRHRLFQHGHTAVVRGIIVLIVQ